jgi:hypothetical protein
METIVINSKISDILFSLEEFSGNRYFLVKKENGDLVGVDELLYQSGKSSFIKSLISKNIYYVCLYYRTNGDIVRRLEVLKKRDKDSFFKALVHKINTLYFRVLFSRYVVREASLCNITNKVEIAFTNGKILKINLYKLI